MGKKKQLKAWRTAFRESCLQRDRNKCVMCGKEADAVHHITPRKAMEKDGYVPENGISLCAPCHIMAEEEHTGFEPGILYKMIGSSKEKAEAALEKLT